MVSLLIGWKKEERVFERNTINDVCLSDVLSVIAQGPASVPAPGPGPSDEKLDFDDDTIKGEKNNCQLVYYPILLHRYTYSVSFRGIFSLGLRAWPKGHLLGLQGKLWAKKSNI